MIRQQVGEDNHDMMLRMIQQVATVLSPTVETVTGLKPIVESTLKAHEKLISLMEGGLSLGIKEKEFNELSPQPRPILQYGNVHLIRRPGVGQGSQSNTAPAQSSNQSNAGGRVADTATSIGNAQAGGHVDTHLLPSQVGGMPVGQQGTEQGAESQSRVRRSTGEREPEQQAPQLGAFPATTVPQAPSDLEINYMVEALQQLGIDVRPLMRPTSRKPIDRVHKFPKG